ncbi:hypothetical protein MAR_012416 [Mya arenaria]|uniref:Uncharacterized protein n=1 Tax=Mya arenaria TaxID=6604 RepID=A0ABY7G083_MYAAR|nr:hypothetical protein MAR_012416 [Mya arenaria]
MYTAIYTVLTGIPSEKLKIKGGDHIETRAVRSYLNNLEVSLKTAKNDVRSSERPYSSLTWRSHDLANIERKSHLQSAKSSSFGQLSRPGSTLSKAGSHMSRSYSQNMSRPVSGHFDVTGAPMSQRTSLASFLPASERIMLETSKPRLLHRESVDRKLKQKLEVMSPQYSPHEEQISDSENKKHIHVDMEAVSERNGHAVDSGTLLDSYGNEGEKTSVKFRSSPLSPHSQENRLGAETPPQRLFRRFGSPQNASGDAMVVRSGEVALRTSENSFIPRRETSHKHKRPVGSARSVGSSLYTSYSGTSITSHKSNCDIPRGPFSIHLSNSRTTTMGPHSSVTSLLGDTGPRDISKGIHHKSAWYHVPGRYTTPDLKHAPKRSQKRSEAKDLEKTIAPTAPNPYTTFMKSDYRKNNPNMLYKGYPEWNGHTCTKGKTNTPYPRHDKKQYTICEQCRHDAEEILAEREEELMRMVECGTEVEMGLAPTVNGLTAPDRPRQMGYVLEEPIIPEDYGHPPTVTFKDTVVFN